MSSHKHSHLTNSLRGWLVLTLFAGGGFPTLAQLPPYAHTQAATLITSNSATLNGMCVPNGLPTTVWFEWGSRDDFGQMTSPSQLGSGSAVVRVTSGIVGLTNRAVYQCRLVSSNSAGVTYGWPQLFTTGRKIWMWGNSSYGSFVFPGTITNIVALAAGRPHTVALYQNGKVNAWPYTSPGAYVPTGLSNVIAVAARFNSSIALRANGTLAFWGGGGSGDAPPNSVSNVIAVAVGDSHGVALRSNGLVAVWGNNSHGQTNMPSGLSNVVAIAGGGVHSLALKADGTVVVWGDKYNLFGVTNVPSGLSNIVAIAGGFGHSLALKQDGTVVSWGTNTQIPALILPSGLSNVIAVSAGDNHSLALRHDGTLVGWGYNNYGQATVPAGLSNVVAVAAGGEHSVAIADNVPPQVQAITNSGYATKDQLVQLRGWDTNVDALTFRIVSLPAVGQLRQYGSPYPIVAANTVVSNAAGYLWYTPPPFSIGAPIANFEYVANDGEADSLSAPVTFNVVLPPAPLIAAGKSQWYSNRFEINFSGQSNAFYRVWASTNLTNWFLLGNASATSNGWFYYLDSGASNWPCRFYRAGAP